MAASAVHHLDSFELSGVQWTVHQGPDDPPYYGRPYFHDSQADTSQWQDPRQQLQGARLMSLRFHHRNAPQMVCCMGGTFHPVEHCVLEVRVRKSMCHHAGQRLRVHAFNSTGDRAQASIRVSSLLLAVTVMGMLAIFVCRIAYLHAYFPDLLFPTKQRKTRHRVRNKMKNQARSSICITQQQLFQDLNPTWLGMHDTHVSATKAC